MKKYLLLILVLPLLWSCDEDDKIELEAITEQSLKADIERHKVDALVFCCTDCDCIQRIGHGTDFGFPGNNQVRIRDQYYDIDKIFGYRIETVHDDWEKEIQMILHFG